MRKKKKSKQEKSKPGVELKKGLVVGLSTALLLAGAGTYKLSKNYHRPRGYEVLEVLDGDTIVVEKAQKIRLLSVDAPALEFCGGKEAKKALEKLVVGKKIYLEEVVADRLQRIVAMVYVEEKSVNVAMVKQGWVKFNSIYSTEKENIQKMQEEAKINKLGIWSKKCYQTNENYEKPECDIKGNVGRDNTRHYFTRKCSVYSRTVIEKFLGDEWFCSESQAKKAGFTLAGNCY